MGARAIFDFSLYAVSLLVILVTYFKRSTQDVLTNKSIRK